MKKGAKGFTIIEVTIAMLISALVIGITYTVYLTISRAYLLYDRKHQEMAYLLKLNELLHKDFERSTAIIKDTDGIVAQYDSHLIKYKFDTVGVFRIMARIDTFKIKTDTFHLSFENKELDVVSIDDERNRVDQLDISFRLEKEKIAYHYHKTYSSQDLINRNPHAVN